MFAVTSRQSWAHASSSVGCVELGAVVEATFSLAPDACAAVGKLLSMLGLPNSLLPSANRNKITIRREIAKQAPSGESATAAGEAGALPLLLASAVNALSHQDQFATTI